MLLSRLDRKLGWIISAIILAATAAAFWLITRGDQPSEPTQFGRSAPSYVIHLPTDPDTLLSFTESYEVLPLYRQAIAGYEANPSSFNRYSRVRSTSAVELQDISGPIDLLLRAARSNRSGIFADRFEQLMDYDPTRPRLSALRTLARALLHLGLLHKAEGNLPVARQHFEAVFALGSKLFRERITLWALDLAHELLGDAALALAALHEQVGDADRAARFRKFDIDRKQQYARQIQPVRNEIWSIAPHTGDMIALALHALEPLWRTEAALALGRCKYSAARQADQKAAVHTLRTLSADPDPRIRAAANAALNLPIETYRMLR